ncbi:MULTISPECIES: carbohydrate ABC transporter permease [Microbispora]|uniref:Sugar transporter n=1 Tax=Microbispora siamensis TaxID=564413 RepID=A0ABQ4GT11_9ACTN|nr:carbohydrate ABC transporter permease [Microbispora siamensis]GIH64583.1 sugar transporter [Microbispora siamensis]
MTGLRRGAGYLLVALAVVVFLYPIWWMVVSSLKPGASILNDPLGVGPFTLDNFRAMFGSVPIGQALGNTVLVVAVKGAITMVLCPLAGYGFAKYSFRFKELLFGVVLLTLMLPTLTLVIPLLLEMKQLGWINTYQALILPGAVDAFSVFYMRQTISQVPDELLDAAAIDAAGTLRTFWSVVVPVIRPGLAALAVLTFFNIYNDLVWPIVAVNDPARQTVSVLLAGLATNVTGGSTSSGFDLWGQLMAACTIATIPTVIIFLLVQRHFIKGLLAGSVK